MAKINFLVLTRFLFLCQFVSLLYDLRNRTWFLSDYFTYRQNINLWTKLSSKVSFRNFLIILNIYRNQSWNLRSVNVLISLSFSCIKGFLFLADWRLIISVGRTRVKYALSGCEKFGLNERLSFELICLLMAGESSRIIGDGCSLKIHHEARRLSCSVKHLELRWDL